jgi:hypothetical protein
MSRTYAFVDIDTGDVKFTQTVSSMINLTDGEINGDSLVVDITNDHENENLYATSKYYDNGWKDKPTKPGNYYKWTKSGWEFDSGRFWSKVRSQRDSLLVQSDWTQLSDAPLTDAQKAEWQTYRQALRDVPINNSAATSLEEVVWPAAPTL